MLVGFTVLWCHTHSYWLPGVVRCHTERKGVDLNAGTLDTGATALFAAAGGGFAEVVKVLADAGAHPSLPTSDTGMSVHLFCYPSLPFVREDGIKPHIGCTL